MLLTAVTSVDPSANSHVAAISTDVAATFDRNIDPATATPQTFAVHSMQGGQLIGAAATARTTGATVTLNPSSHFFPGDIVQASVTSGIQSTNGAPAVLHVWQFRTAVPFGNGEFSDGSQILGNHYSVGVSLGDLDGDGDLDAFVANFNQGNRVWLNNGDGLFSDIGQSLGDHISVSVALGDLDGDGDLDAFVSNWVDNGNRVWINNGSGQFSDSGQSLGDHRSTWVSLGDLDADGDLDAFVANGYGQGNRVWRNDGGLFTDSGQALGNYDSYGISLGDVDGDGDLDAFVANTNFQSNRVWLNDGGSLFGNTGQNLGNRSSRGVSLGDVDGDGDLDAFVANGGGANSVWRNNGNGLFADSGQNLGNHSSFGVSLGDVDGDGDLDAFTVNVGEGNRVWRNNGDGLFSDSGQALGNHNSYGISLGDVDGDGDLDAFVANGEGYDNRVWLGNSRPSLAVIGSDATKAEGDAGNTPFTFTVLRGGDASGTTLVSYAVSGSGANAADALDFGGALPNGVLTFSANETSQTVVINVSGDKAVEADEGFTVTLASPTPATTEIVKATASGTIENDDTLPPTVTLSVDNPTIPEAAGVATFMATLSAKLEQPVTVDLSITGTAIESDDYRISGTQIVIPASATSGSVTVTSLADTLITEGPETVIVDIATVSANATEDGEQQAATTIVDDVGGPDVTLSVDRANIGENGGVSTFTATLAFAFSLPVTIDLGITGTAAASDYTASATQIVIPVGATTGSMSVATVDDALIEGDETVVVDITKVTNGQEAGTQQATTTITDDENPPTVTLSVDNTRIAEAGGTATLTATLSAVSTLEVTVDLGFSGTATAPDDYTRSGTQIVIAAGSTTGTVTVTGVEEALDDGDESVIVDIIGVVNGTEHETQQQTTTIIDDDDAPTLPLGPTPAAASHDAPASTSVNFRFSQDVTPSTVTDQTFVVHARQSGRLIGGATTLVAAGPIVAHSPTNSFFPGERVQATITSSITTTAGPATSQVWQFRTGVPAGSGVFDNSGQSLGSHASSDVSLGDLDADGDLDAFVANYGSQGNRVWLNDDGRFSDSGQSLGVRNSVGVSLGDLDGDGDLDAFVANLFQGNRVWLNERGQFRDSGQSLGNHSDAGVSLGDLDGDGDLDAFTANYPGQGNRVWLNEGGRFSDSGQSLGSHSSFDISLGDLDGDGDLDAFVANVGQANRVWLNNGGQFSDSGQRLGNHLSLGVSLGDLDGDGDLDAFVANYASQGNRVWLNNGGQFSDSGQVLGNQNTYRISLGDLDGDGDLDAFVANQYQGNRVWLNNAGLFSDGGQILGDHVSSGVSLGDVDGDGDLDAFVTNFAEGNRVWLNQNLTPQVTLSVDNASIVENGGTATFTATLSAAHNNPVAVDLEISGTATATDDYTVSDTQIVIPAGATTSSVTITAIQDAVDEPDETVIVDITSVTNGQEAGVQQITTTILDDDEPRMPDVTLTVDNGVIPEAAGVATFSVTLSEPTTIPVSIELEISGTATATADYTASTQIVVPPGATTGSITVTAVQDTLDEPNETVIVDIAAVSGGSELGAQQQTTTIIDDDNPPSFMISSLLSTSSGFVAQLSTDVDASVLNLYGSTLGGPDAVLTGATSGLVAGSLVVDPSLRTLSFIKTGDPLAADNYTVTLRSGDNGFKDLAGNLLDGNRDGTAGDDFIHSFTVAPPAANAVTLALPDFVRGAGQDVNLPADMTTGIPLSISISEGTTAWAVDLRISYDPALLDITAATVGENMPAGSSVVLNTNTPGLAILVFFSTAPLPADTNTLVNLQAAVPTTNVSENYGRGQVLDIHSVVVSDGLDNESPVIDDDAMHLAAYFADVSGNGRINASDASQVARFAALLETGFAGSQLTDPIILGDISGNRRINAADASLLAQFAALIPVPEIPPIPVGVVAADGGGFGSRVLPPPQEPQEETGQNLEAPSTAITGWDRLPDYYPAIDTLMTVMDKSPTGGAAREEVPMALEEAIEQLFSALDLVPKG